MAEELSLKFVGLDSDRHVMPMGQLGASLVGADKIINFGLIFMSFGRLPKRGERFDLVATVREPREGSYEIVAILQQAPWVLPIVQEFLISGGVDASYRFISFVLTKFGGRPREANMHLDALIQLNRDHLQSRDLSDESWRNTLLAIVDRLAPQARDAVKPIGSGASVLSISGPRLGQRTDIDEPMADSIRSSEESEVGDMEKMTISVDGITHHNKQLKIAHPSIEGKYITAEVRDPNFDDFPNAYTDAASTLSTLKVMAKPLFRNGELKTLYIMDLARD